MKIIWLCNIMLPQIAVEIGKPVNVFGGWLSGAITALLEDKNNEIMCVFPYSEELNGSTDNLSYVSFKQIPDDFVSDELINKFETLVSNYNPDVIHIWGTEFSHSLCMVQACKRINYIDKVVVNLQGIISKIADAYTLGLPKRIIYGKSFRDLIRRDSVNIQQQRFYNRGKNEVEVLKCVKHVIGRTEWDKRVSLELNPKLNYHFCNESLRDVFYQSNAWNITNCSRYRIFCSQGGYPIKGLHFVIPALAKLKEVYPEVKLCVTGRDFVNVSFKENLKLSMYFKYLRNLVVKNNLKDNIEFLGNLSADKMIEQYLKCNVFLSPSTIENSSNSIAEAMICGTPVVSSNVGGCSTMVNNGNTGILYDLEDTNILVNAISNIFDDSKYALILSQNARKTALQRDYKKVNNKTLINIYKQIIKSNTKE